MSLQALQPVVFGSLSLISVGYFISIILTIGFGLFVLKQNPSSKNNILFSLTCLALAIFDISFLFGINTTDLELARLIWLGNIATIFIVIFYAHWTFSIIDYRQDNRLAIKIIYIVGIALAAACLLFQDLWIAGVSPKLYLNSFIDPGPLYGLMVIYFYAVAIYAFVRLLFAYREGNPEEQNRYKYFLLAGAAGYLTGASAYPLTWDIPLDPIASMLTSLFVIPLTYGIVKSDIMDFNIVARKAASYGIGIGLISGILLTISLLNNWFLSKYPDLGYATVPVIAGTVSFFIGRYFWLRLKESENMKYEFITVAAHKLRTPLTRIKWGIGSLMDTIEVLGDRKMLNSMNLATEQLIHIADVLLEAAESDNRDYNYHYVLADFVEVIKEAVRDASRDAALKNITISTEIEAEIPPVHIDIDRINSVLGVLLENAITYTPEGGAITVRAYARGVVAWCEVSDTGIGLSPEESRNIFGRFYRSERAIKTDTEGIGLGLYMAKTIISRHGGVLTATSEGEHKGSIFSFSVRLGHDLSKEESAD